jgi:hypothetical protein
VILLTDAPPIFDVVGFGLVAFTGLAVFGWASNPARRAGSDPRHARYESLVLALGCLAISVYVIVFLSSVGMGGFGALLAFVFAVNDGRHSWTVWLTLASWAALTGFSLLTIASHIRKPIGDRSSLPYAKHIIAGVLCAALWFFEIFLPLSRTNALLWRSRWAQTSFLHVRTSAALRVASPLLYCRC